MYNRQLRNRYHRMLAVVIGSKAQVTAMPVPSLFGSSFLDNFRIEYTPKDFADIDWGGQDVPSWERATAS